MSKPIQSQLAYYQRCTERAVLHKLFASPDSGCAWLVAESWNAAATRCLLAKVAVQPRDGTFYVYVQDFDDFDMAARGLSCGEAKAIFERITPGMSQADLAELGLQVGG